MKLRAIVPDVKVNASTWWRIVQPFRYLSKDHNTKIALYEDVPSLDVYGAIVFVHRLICDNPKAYVRELKKRGAKQVIYSLDDWTTNEVALRDYLSSCGAMTQAAIQSACDAVHQQKKTIQACDGLLVSTPQLAELVYDDIKINATVIENGIPLDFWYEAISNYPRYQKLDELVYIGWAGGRRPDTDLLPMAKAWGRISNQYDNVRFVVGGYQPDVIDENIDLDMKVRLPWASFDEWPKSMQVDIGCCPLADTPYNRGKSAIKFFEYTASGAAVIASPTIYNGYVNNYANGYIVHDEYDWYTHLTYLVEFENTRRTMQRIALYDVTNYNSLDSTIIDWNVWLNEYADQGVLLSR